METNLKINVSDYLSDKEIKEIITDQIRLEVATHFKEEKNAQRMLSNLSYEIVFNEVDKAIPNCRQVIVDKTTEIIGDIKSYLVFRDASYGATPSLAYKIMEQVVVANKDLLNQKVKEVIETHDYSSKIWDKFESLADSFMSNIYSIVELGRNKKA